MKEHLENAQKWAEDAAAAHAEDVRPETRRLVSRTPLKSFSWGVDRMMMWLRQEWLNRKRRAGYARRLFAPGRRPVGAGALCAAVIVALASLGVTPAASAPTVTLTWWSHFASAANNQKVLLNAARRYEQAHPDVAVKITFYEKEQMILALRAAFAAGQSTPDVYYYDNDMSEFITAGYAAVMNSDISLS